MQELCADPIIQAHAARNILHIGVELLAQIGDFVDEGDLGRQECIGCVLD